MKAHCFAPAGHPAWTLCGITAEEVAPGGVHVVVPSMFERLFWELQCTDCKEWMHA